MTVTEQRSTNPLPETPAPERGLTRRWRVRLPEASNTPLIRGVQPLTSRILTARGLDSPDTAGAFLAPSLRNLHDPSLIPDLDRAAERLLHAARRRQPIVVYGDYDVDGTTATAILVRTIRAIEPEADVRTYVPHRLDEGYGLNSDAITELARAGAAVIVSVDCGITARQPAMAARSEGVDLIITDHHNPPATMDDLPDAFAVVHPRRPDSVYPFGELCGAGVAYKLAWRMATMHAGSERVGAPMRDVLVELLALAALGVIADVVPLQDENRVIARFGLGRIKHSPLQGLRALVEASGLAGDEVDAEHVGFRLGPRLNACGRMGHARDTVELLLTENPARATEIAEQLTKQNESRRAVERSITERAAALAEAQGMTGPDRRAIVLADPDWHPGVVGIVCSRLVERFGRPTILLQRREDGECHGSGRSVDGYSLHAALEACAPHLLGFGGHDMAAGLRLHAEGLDAFTEAFIQHANDALSEEDLIPPVEADCDASLEELTPAAVQELERLAPFGRENPPVRVRVRGLQLASNASPFGRSGSHLSLQVRPAGDGLVGPVRIVGWNWAEYQDALPGGVRVDAIVEPKLNRWNGQTRVEPKLVDLRREG